jgi:anti-sigma factor RsiW
MTDWDSVDFGGITCRQFVELVTDYLEDELDPDTRRRFETHVAGCPGCARYLDQIRETRRVLGRVQLETISAGARAQLLTAFRAWRSAEPGSGSS